MTDYNKMKKLLLLDKLDGNRKGINGMLTIKDTFGDMLILGIPNNNVRKQYYGYLLEQYQEEKFVDLTQMKILFTGMALEGKWRDALETMAKAYEDVSSVRDGFFVLLLVLVQLIAHTILNVVVDNEVELFFCKAVMLRQKQGLYVYFIYFFRKIDSLCQDIQYVGIVDDGVEV